MNIQLNVKIKYNRGICLHRNYQNTKLNVHLSHFETKPIIYFRHFRLEITSDHSECFSRYYLISASGSHGSPITKAPKLSGPDVTPPPPLLPPKTRKLLGETARPGSQESTGTGPAQTAASTNTTKRHQLQPPATSGHNQASDIRGNTLEASEASVSVVRIGPGVTRSVSSAGARPLRTRAVKPLRRSKSHLTTQGRCVTNITHGGSVTLVSLNSQEQSREFQPIEPDLSPR